LFVTTRVLACLVHLSRLMCAPVWTAAWGLDFIESISSSWVLIKTKLARKNSRRIYSLEYMLTVIIFYVQKTHTIHPFGTCNWYLGVLSLRTSSLSLCYMRIRKRKKIHENLLTVGKRTSLPWYSTCMCLHYLYVSTHLHLSTLHPHVYSISTCPLYIHMSTLYPHVYSISTCLLYIHMYTLHPHVYSTSTRLLYIHMSTLYPHVYSTSKCLLYIHVSTPHPYVYSTSTCMHYIHMSTLHPHVYSISTCLLYIHMSTLYPHVYSTSKCLLYIHVSTPHPYVYSTSTCLLYVHMSTPSLRVYPSFTYLIQFRTYGEFENENNFALAP